MGSSLLRNAVYIMLTTGVNSGLGYVFWLVVARSYRAEEVGVASALIAAMTVVAAVADLGTSTALIQRLPSQRTDADWSRTLTASVATASAAGLAIALVAGAAIVPALSDSLSVVDSSASHLLLFAGGVVIWSLSAVSDYLFVAERRSENMFVRNLVFGVAKLAIVAALALAGDDAAIGIFAAWVAGCAVSLAVGYSLLVPRLSRRYRPALAGLTREVREMAGLYAGNYFVTLGYLLTTFLLPLIVVVRRSPEETAYFYVAWLLGGAFFTVTASVGSALFAEGTNDPQALARQTRSAVRISAALLAPLMLVFFAAAGPILGLFGEDYADNGTTLLVLLTASAVPDAITGLYLARVRAEGRLAFPAVASMGMAAATLAGSWLLLPSMELAGPGVAFVAAHVAGSVACLLDARLRSSG
ncbi:MAG TPA: lipopolysaccharide biosynthesis protein [Thermoleophilaceae bacterium]|jgi:O-antigen/teichoic acid export membrane protein